VARVSAVWASIGLAAVAVFVAKAAGPVLLVGRELPAAVRRALVLLPAALLAALVVTQTFADGRALVLDARAAGLAVAMLALLARRGLLTVLLLATLTTAGLRALG
jgi:branched-subunit amino acid transport protein